MSEFLRSLQPLGTTYGVRQAYTTTFTDEGMVARNSPLRRTYSHSEPTFIGLLAGSMRLLRLPQLVYGLGALPGERSLAQHLLGVYGVWLAAIFGDTTTAAAISNLILAVHHQQRFEAEDQPQWLRHTLGRRAAFSAYDPELRRAVIAVLAAGVARAHVGYGLLAGHQDGEQYCRDLRATIGYVADVELDIANLNDLYNLGNKPGVPLMDRRQVMQAGVPDMLETLLATELAEGVPLSTFTLQIKALTSREDRTTLHMPLSTSDSNVFERMKRTYGHDVVVHSHTAPELVPAESTTHLSRLNFFTVAARQTS